jgi:hypothetical protein
MTANNNIARIADALSYVPADDRDTWLKMGMAVKSELGDEGFDLWDEWSQKSNAYNAADARNVWTSTSPDGGITVGTLFHVAKACGWSDTETYNKPTPEERETRQKEATERLSLQHAKARNEAMEIWTAASLATENHAYLVRKGVKSHGLRVYHGQRTIGGMPCNGSLIVPAYRAKGEMQTLAFIHPNWPNDDKRFLPGGEQKGCYFPIGAITEETKILCIAEGFATAASIHEATGYPTVAAFSAGNLEAVARVLHEHYPSLKLILCADDDDQTPGNPGLTKANEAAVAAGGKLALPDFGANRPRGATDFNDMHQHLGPEAVKRAIENAGEPTAWGEPIPFDEIDTPDIPARLLPENMGKFAEALANATETPEAMAVLTVLGVVATAVSTRFCVSPVDGWTEPLNFYCLIALPSGNNKSTVLNACTAPLVEWEHEQARIQGAEILRQRSERKSKEKIIEAKRAALAAETDSASQDALMQEIAEMEASLAEPKVLPQLFANDVTPESLAATIHEQGGRFAIFSDEGGITETLSGLYTGGQANIDILLKGIDGGNVRVRRKDRQFDLNPILTVGLVVQPVIIERMGEKKAFSGRGLLERFLWVLPKSKLGYRTHDKPPVPEVVKNSYKKRIRTLLDIPPLIEGFDQPRVLKLEPAALTQWREFQAKIEVQLRFNGRLSRCQGWGGKISGFALRLAGLLHVSEYKQDNLIISSRTMTRALELATLLTDHALAAYGLIGTDQATADAQECWRWIQALGEPSFTNGELTLAMRHRIQKDRLTSALTILRDRELISEPKRVPGKKTLIYRVHPKFVRRV